MIRCCLMLLWLFILCRIRVKVLFFSAFKCSLCLCCVYFSIWQFFSWKVFRLGIFLFGMWVYNYCFVIVCLFFCLVKLILWVWIFRNFVSVFVIKWVLQLVLRILIRICLFLLLGLKFKFFIIIKFFGLVFSSLVFCGLLWR